MDIRNPLESMVHVGVGVSLSVRVSVSMGDHWVLLAPGLGLELASVLQLSSSQYSGTRVNIKP